MVTVFIALGANLGDKRRNLATALQRLEPQVQVQRGSSTLRTAPWGYAQQPEFLNQVIQCRTILSPHQLLKHLQNIEKGMGRKATFRYGPRLIDLDILFYGELALESPDLTIPHPRLHERTFVLLPLVEIAPGWVHPLYRKNTAELLSRLEAQIRGENGADSRSRKAL